MKHYEFGPTLQRLSYLATMVEATDVEGVIEHLDYADTLAPLFGSGPEGIERLQHLRAFLDKAMAFKNDCRAFHGDLSEADRVVGRNRRELAEASPPALPVNTTTKDGG